MSIGNTLQSRWVRVGIVAIIIAVGLGAMAIPPVRESMQGLFAGKTKTKEASNANDPGGAEFIEVGENQGIRLSAEVAKSLDLKPVKVALATKDRPIAPQTGTLNYDNDRMFTIRSRFPGELAEVRRVVDTEAPLAPTRERPMRFGDKVKQGDLLAVIWSQQLGAAKALLVDAVCALRLSQDTMRRFQELDKNGALPEVTLKVAERQLQMDSNNLLTAERSLRMWKMTDKEIDDIKAEANFIHDQKKARKSDDEMKWARVEIRVPVDNTNPNHQLVLVEKNTNLNDMVDPINSPPLFRLADTSRLQIWVHPPEEYLPLIREGLMKNGPGRLQWDIRFQADPPNTPPRKLDIVQISPSLEPNQHTPMVLGYLPNPDGKYLIGQFVTATIYVSPDEHTVEIPTDALNQLEGQALIFVQKNLAKNEYTLRRVAVVRSFKDVTFVRTKLTEEEKNISLAEVARGHRPLEPLLPGEYVMTGMIVQLTTALENLAVKTHLSSDHADVNK